LLVGAGIALHYLDGAYYPRGGGQVLADRLADAIEEQGGRVMLGTRVDRIRLAGGAVAGVDLMSRRLGCRTVYAPVVVCNADLKRTVSELVGEEAFGERGAEAARSATMAPPLAVLYLGLKRDLVDEGHPRANYWVHADDDIEAQYRAAEEGRFVRDPCAFVTLASVKDPSNPRLAPPGHSNIQVMTVAPAQPSAWGLDGGDDYRRQPAYLERKAEFSEALMGTLERVLPGSRDAVAMSEVATPMTHTRYTGATGGTSYGLAAVPGQFGMRRPGPTTRVGGLYLCGASCRTGHGILGAAASGLAAAAAVLPGHLDRSVLPG
jgi:phytoene dehydrogenase-like protein